MTNSLRISIDGRPTREPFFTSGQETMLRVGMDREVIEASDDDLEYLRSAPLPDLASNTDVQRALALASAYAASMGKTVDGAFVYFD